MDGREVLLTMRASDDAVVRKLRVKFESTFAEKKRRVALSAQKSEMYFFVCGQLFFRVEY